ncbi:MAG TPA: glucose-6-phosphate dehydrogenase assembly protein OpcA [Pyrinomonadaceae bacterium]|nr:glucose-6-phosphate dehydrogenase assembly protein OpcA [Pyrinomonadaceae bacterium]
MQTQEHTVALSTTKGIDVSKLERELSAMWATATDSGAAGGARSGVTRACVLNLVACTTHYDDRGALDELLGEVIEHHPCRALVLITERDAPGARLDAYVSTRCQLSTKGAKQICGEQVTIEAAGRVVETAASAVAPLLIPDVPVFLWWKDIPQYDDKLFKKLVALADRVIVDSRSFDQPYEDLLHLAAAVNGRSKGIHFSDLNWGRLTAWRTLLAGFWDVPEYRPHLDNINRVHIAYEQPHESFALVAVGTLLALGWLAAQLNWEIATSETAMEDGTHRIGFRRGERRITVELQPVPVPNEGDPMIVSTSLIASEGDAEFYVKLKPERTKLVTGARIGGDAHGAGHVLTYEAKSEGERLSRELNFLARDTAYEKALTLAARVIEVLQLR